MFSFEDGSELETVPDASEFLRDNPDIQDDYSALVCLKRGQFLADCFITESMDSFGYLPSDHFLCFQFRC
jgi:hypothetical protein